MNARVATASGGAATVAPYATGPSNLRSVLAELPGPAGRAVWARLRTLVESLGSFSDGDDLADLADVVAELVGSEPDTLWLAHSVLAAELPGDETMNDLLVRARLGGTWAALRPVLDTLARADRFRAVEVRRGAVTFDVHATASSVFVSGIQRVVRETALHWRAHHDVEFLAWTGDLGGLRSLSDAEHRRLFDATPPRDRAPTVPPMIVPWEGTHIWAEVITELPRVSRLLALAECSRNEVAVLGHDCIPITTAATVAEGMTAHFARSLAAVRQADRVAMVSRAAAAEYASCVQMGAGRRDAGPQVAAIPLASTSKDATHDALDEVRDVLMLDHVPMVLVVGSHEPRKNHLSVLHAAELLWRDGLRFGLVFVGAGAWGSQEYERTIQALTAAGRPVQSIRGLPDRLLWAAYRLAHCTVFPSLNEGFGLPVVESLAVGTPVITSDFGSMRDLISPQGKPLGGLLVDPRDDASIRNAIRSMLTDGPLHARLKIETALHEQRSWDTFADELWSYLVNGVRPPGDPGDEPTDAGT